tara:strand:- start:934 stop:2463 length:1530 start_codon:yes stop_codon:yes gene_type:complete
MKDVNKKELLKKALTHHKNGEIDAADKIYITILESDSFNFDANHLHALVLSQKKNYIKAIEFFSKAYSQGPATCELLNNFAIAYRNLKAYRECEKLLLEALTLDKKFINTYKNLSNCFLSQKKYDDALEVLETAYCLDKDSTKIICKIIEILFTKIGNKNNSEYIKKYEKYAEELAKNHHHTNKALSGLCYLHLDNIETSSKLFKEAELLVSGTLPSINTLKSLKDKKILLTMIKHEYEQISHIDSDADGIRNVKITQKFYDSLKKIYYKNDINFSDQEYEFISSLHKIRYNKAPKSRLNYLNKKHDTKLHEKIYKESNPQIVIIDDFLDESYLYDLRKFFRCANIFKYPYPAGYIGAFLGKGLANKSVLELSKELKETFPSIFDMLSLSQAWAYKYDSQQKGISIHADDAKVNVNFWITDDSANLNKQTGGMIVWGKEPSLDTKFSEFNSLSSIPKMEEEVKNTNPIKIPYKSNRAVIFNSKLYHATDDIDFKDDYINRRINVTFLYK